MRSVVALVCLLLRTSECFLFLSSGKALESYNVDPQKISVSGISSGAAMATQIHVIFSREIMGVGLVAGVPFACAGSVGSFVSCMSAPGLVSVAALEATTTAGAAVGNIDATSNIANDKVYIYNGKLDTTVNPAIGSKIEEFYRHFIPNSNNIKTVFNISSVHAHITDNYGGPCDQPHEENYLNNCNYSAAFDLLNHIYGGNLQKPSATTQQNGQLMAFSQSDFFYVSTPGMYSMDDTGYIYVPSGCVNKRTACKLHVAFHGCKMYHKRIGDAYIRHGGYNEVGELNNIIILYPQTVTSATNPNGCWDWWGYTGALFATQSGFQPTALRRMIHKAAGI
ncbi:uncharacterized protein LOC127851632 [Dreissena polymorpha]|uniref:Uncharacterized protein n=1 Tax=Dreissena polymorpha TaxID=45954 RepID=A0A9D4D7V2_DREPO|nr:uncharacterized protein LOC127851632 [Dreissena polymorpha]KAH3739752.1 hypothetical protein DPMN_046439 [Dreissena polymorpha]